MPRQYLIMIYLEPMYLLSVQRQEDRRHVQILRNGRRNLRRHRRPVHRNLALDRRLFNTTSISE
jgi:hypothetical protein